MSEIEKIGGSDTKWRADTIEERRKVITELVNRPISFDVILTYAHQGTEVNCELCGNKERGGYWCKPCIHHSWCCVCCILLGVPNYSPGLYAMMEPPAVQHYKCAECRLEVDITEDDCHRKNFPYPEGWQFIEDQTMVELGAKPYWLCPKCSSV